MHVTVRGESAAGVRTAKATMNFNYGSPYYGMRLPVGTWNVTASGIDDSGVTFTFSPAGGWGNALAVTGSMQSIDFVLDRAARHDLTGRVVYADGPGVAGTTVRVGPRTATTADDGRYVIYGVPAGAYPIVVTKPGLRFHRASARVTDDGASAGVVTALTPSPGNVVPAIVLAEASPPTVAYRATWLTALAADEDPADRLRYTWSVFARPAGAEVTFELNSRELNGTNSAQHILALFDQPGTYILRVKAIDESGAESAAAYVRLYVGSPDS